MSENPESSEAKTTPDQPTTPDGKPIKVWNSLQQYVRSKETDDESYGLPDDPELRGQLNPRSASYKGQRRPLQSRPAKSNAKGGLDELSDQPDNRPQGSGDK